MVKGTNGTDPSSFYVTFQPCPLSTSGADFSGFVRFQVCANPSHLILRSLHSPPTTDFMHALFAA